MLEGNMDNIKIMKLDKITMGVCYYPEHWDENLWESDLRRMQEAGIGVIRIAEFAWNKFEPEEGIFTFDFFRQVHGAGRKNAH
jgi:beta-galactosidase